MNIHPAVKLLLKGKTPTAVLKYSGKIVGVNARMGYSRKLGRGFTTKKYKEFLAKLISLVSVSNLTPASLIVIEMSLSPRRDIDSAVKPILDALERSGALVDDVSVSGLMCFKQRNRKRSEPEVIICTVYEHTENPFAPAEDTITHTLE